MSKMILSDSSHCVMIMRTLHGRNLHCTLDLWGGTILMKDLVRPKPLGGPTVSLTYHGSLLKRQCLMKLFLCFYQSPAFYFFSDCGVSLLDMVCV